MMGLKKVVLFIHPCGTRSGACNSIISLIESLDKSLYDPYVLCPEGSAFDALAKVATKIFPIPTPPELITISGYPFNNLRLFYCIFLIPKLSQIVKLIDSIKPDLIHLNELSLTPLAYLLKKTNYKIVIHARIVLDSNKKLLNSIIVYLLRKYSDHIFCIDGSVMGPLKSIKHTSIVYNSYQFDSKSLERKGKLNEKFVVLFLANLISHKGIFDLIEASILLKQNTNIEIWVCGVNSRNDNFYESLKGKMLSKLNIVPNNMERIQNVINTHKLENVKMFGHVSNIKKIILESSVLIFPSYMNGPPRSVFEAGVFGVPSIISLKDKVEDVVEDNVNGLIIEEHSPEQIADAILKLYNNKALCEQLGKNASQKYTALNDPMINIKKVEAVYESLLNHG
jgi:glycosyltransferase involved in cell wall biosynthesis